MSLMSHILTTCASQLAMIGWVGSLFVTPPPDTGLVRLGWVTKGLHEFTRPTVHTSQFTNCTSLYEPACCCFISLSSSSDDLPHHPEYITSSLTFTVNIHSKLKPLLILSTMDLFSTRDCLHGLESDLRYDQRYFVFFLSWIFLVTCDIDWALSFHSYNTLHIPSCVWGDVLCVNVRLITID